MDQQTQALLSYNAANPEVIRRIVQERGLTQDQVAQALNLSPEAAARYGGISAAGEGAGQVDPNATKPGPGDSAQMGSMNPVGAANAASQALLGGDNVERVGDTYAGRVAGGG